jgi:hypothetical protein
MMTMHRNGFGSANGPHDLTLLAMVLTLSFHFSVSYVGPATSLVLIFNFLETCGSSSAFGGLIWTHSRARLKLL